MPDPARTLPLCAMLCAAAGCVPADRPAAAPERAPAAVAAPAPRNAEVEALRAEVARLAAENAQLRLSPSALALRVDEAVRAGDADKAQASLQQLVDRFPFSAEAGAAGKRVEALVARRLAEQEEAKRIAALGFKGLKIKSSFASGDTTIGVSQASIARRWTFDSYGEGWRFLDAEKDKKYLIARMTISSKGMDPSLFGIAAYVTDGAKMTQVGNLSYRFARWQDFGAYLGTHFDFSNDFRHNSRVPFSAAAAISAEQLKRRPLYLVVTREGCHRRGYERFGQPPVFYVPQPCASLKLTLALDDFKDGSLAVLKRID